MLTWYFIKDKWFVKKECSNILYLTLNMISSLKDEWIMKLNPPFTIGTIFQEEMLWIFIVRFKSSIPYLLDLIYALCVFVSIHVRLIKKFFEVFGLFSYFKTISWVFHSYSCCLLWHCRRGMVCIWDMNKYRWWTNFDFDLQQPSLDRIMLWPLVLTNDSHVPYTCICIE